MLQIGADTLVRLIDPKYYNQSSTNMVSALSIINERNCKFVVGGRCVGDNFSPAEKILESTRKIIAYLDQKQIQIIEENR